MTFAPTNFWKSVNRRNLDPNPVDVLAGVADSLARSSTAFTGGRGGREAAALRRCHRRIQESYRTRAHAGGSFRKSGPGVHGKSGLWRCHRAPQTRSHVVSRPGGSAPVAGIRSAGPGL